MGQHYVPQRYLRGFQTKDKTEEIWMYDKITATRKLLPIKGVAQAADFYPAEVEQSLNTDVEIPGNAVIDKIRQGGRLAEPDRLHLTYYVATMMQRVPYGRERAYEIVPKALKEVFTEVRDFLDQAQTNGKIAPDLLARRLAELEDTEK